MIEKKGKEIKIVKRSNIDFYGRQEAPKVFDINASIYIWSRNSLLRNKKLINSKTGIYIMPKARSTDIDDLEDFELVKYFMKRSKK